MKSHPLVIPVHFGLQLEERGRDLERRPIREDEGRLP